PLRATIPPSRTPCVNLRDRFSRPLAQVANYAFFAQRPARNTSVTPVQNKPMVGVTFVFGWNYLLQFRFDLKRRVAGGNSSAVTNTENGCSDGDGGSSERDIKHDIGSLAANARQRLQCLARVRHFPAMLGDELACQCNDVFGLHAKQSDGLYQLAHPILAERDHFFGII